MKLESEIIIFDTEFTAWEGSMVRNYDKPNEHREIVQIGAVKISTKDFKELETFEIFVKPKVNPVLSDYFKNLTKITQKQADGGVSFSEAMSKFKDFISATSCYSFGGDERVFRENCELLEIEYPLIDNKFFDIRKYFINSGIDVAKYSSGSITEAFGVPRPVGQHNALVDCRSIIDGLKLLQEKNAS